MEIANIKNIICGTRGRGKVGEGENQGITSKGSERKKGGGG